VLKKHVKPDALDEMAQKAYELMLAWDGNSSKDSAGASIYNTFYVRFAYQTFVDELGENLAAEYVGERYISMERFLEMVAKGSVFFDDLRTPEKEDVGAIATRSFVETCSLLKKYFGSSDPARWKWGRMHVIRFEHVLGKSALFRPLVNYGPFPFEGDGETNNRARFAEMEPPFTANLASAPRIIVKFDPKPKAYMMLITGDNEHFMSRHSTDMVDAWLAHEYFCMEDEAVKYSMRMDPAR